MSWCHRYRVVPHPWLLEFFHEFRPRFRRHQIRFLWRIDRKAYCLWMCVPRANEHGFRVLIQCYGWGKVVVSADEFRLEWEVYRNFTSWHVIDASLAYVRTLLSPDARLRKEYADGVFRPIAVEVRSAGGWVPMPFGWWAPRRKTAPKPGQGVIILWNDFLPSRYPYDLERRAHEERYLYAWDD